MKWTEDAVLFYNPPGSACMDVFTHLSACTVHTAKHPALCRQPAGTQLSVHGFKNWMIVFNSVWRMIYSFTVSWTDYCDSVYLSYSSSVLSWSSGPSSSWNSLFKFVSLPSRLPINSKNLFSISALSRVSALSLLTLSVVWVTLWITALLTFLLFHCSSIAAAFSPSCSQFSSDCSLLLPFTSSVPSDAKHLFCLRSTHKHINI